MDLRNFFAELKRRNVYRVAVAYCVVGWLLVQIATQVFPFFDVPGWSIRLLVLFIVIGFPVAVLLGWAYEITPEGVKRTEEVGPQESVTRRTRRKIDFIIITVLAAVIALLVFDRFRDPRRQGEDAAERSIAVLPFANLSEDKSNAYFADGIQDEILTRLSKIEALKVISRTSTQQFQSTPASVSEIAKQLGVAHILEGSVQKAGESVRVNVQLIKADGDSHLWAETYDRKLADIFAVESEVAERIASSLQAKLTGQEKAAVNYVGTKIPAAYDAYLRGIALRNSQSRDDQKRLIAYCREAIGLDPKYAAAWSEIAVAEGLRFIQGEQTDAQRALVREAAENALRLDPDHGYGHAAMGMYLYYCLQDYDNALIELQQAREQAPSDANVILAVGLVKRRQGKLDEAVELQLQAAQRDPLNQDIWVNIAWSYRGMRRFTDARAMMDRALSIATRDPFIVASKAECYIAEGDLDTAARLYDEIKPRFDSEGYGEQIGILAFQRRYDDAIAKITSDFEKTPSPSPMAVARVHLAIGKFHFFAGRSAEARPFLLKAQAELSAIKEGGNRSPDCLGALLEAHALLGQREEVERVAAEHLARLAKDRWTGPRAEEDVARAYFILGDHDRALVVIERLLVGPSADALTPALLQMDPMWDPVREDPRFQKLVGEKP